MLHPKANNPSAKCPRGEKKFSWRLQTRNCEYVQDIKSIKIKFSMKTMETKTIGWNINNLRQWSKIPQRNGITREIHRDKTQQQVPNHGS